MAATGRQTFGSYAPVDDHGSRNGDGGVTLSYDRVASAIAAYAGQEASAVAAGVFDDAVLTLCCATPAGVPATTTIGWLGVKPIRREVIAAALAMLLLGGGLRRARNLGHGHRGRPLIQRSPQRIRDYARPRGHLFGGWNAATFGLGTLPAASVIGRGRPAVGRRRWRGGCPGRAVGPG